jgi:limonene-1,2-epoxide hydrolase
VTTSVEQSTNSTRPDPAGPADVVRRFLTALADDDIDTAAALVADDIVYENVSLPTIRGKRRFENGARTFSRRGIGFDVRIHRLAEEGSVVLTERTDALFFGRFRAQFWVCGTFEVHDGKITLWRDYFDFWRLTLAQLRGVAGIVAPAIRARFDDEQ